MRKTHIVLFWNRGSGKSCSCLRITASTLSARASRVDLGSGGQPVPLFDYCSVSRLAGSSQSRRPTWERTLKVESVLSAFVILLGFFHRSRHRMAIHFTATCHLGIARNLTLLWKQLRSDAFDLGIWLSFWAVSRTLSEIGKLSSYRCVGRLNLRLSTKIYSRRSQLFSTCWKIFSRDEFQRVLGFAENINSLQM